VGEQADIYERITARIIEQMEQASAAGWQKPWITTVQNTLQPVNAATRRDYRGVNVLML
jgi:antirestriction protein ArdC